MMAPALRICRRVILFAIGYLTFLLNVSWGLFIRVRQLPSWRRKPRPGEMISPRSRFCYCTSNLKVAFVFAFLLRVRATRSVGIRSLRLVDALALETHCFIHGVVPPFLRDLRDYGCPHTQSIQYVD